MFFFILLFPEGADQTEILDDLVGVVLLEVFAQRFFGFGENDVRPRVVRTHRVGGPGEG